MQRFIYEFWSEKSNLSICTGFMHVRTIKPCCLGETSECTNMTSYFGLAFESLIQMNSNQSVLSCISQNTLILPCHCMHHIVSYCHVVIVFRCVLRGRFCLRGYSRVSNWRAVSHYHYVRQANPLIISIQTHLLVSALVYCIKTTRFKLLCVLR